MIELMEKLRIRIDNMNPYNYFFLNDDEDAFMDYECYVTPEIKQWIKNSHEHFFKTQEFLEQLIKLNTPTEGGVHD